MIFVFRFACEMTHIFQYILTSLYLWAYAVICSSLLIVLIELVKCFPLMSTTNCYIFNLFKKNIVFFLFANKFVGKFIGYGKPIDWMFHWIVLVIVSNFFIMSIWSKSRQSIRKL